MNRSYLTWYEKIYSAERGKSDNPADPGGLTIDGISLRSAPPNLKKKILDGTLTKDDAISRYQEIHEELLKKIPSLRQVEDGLHFAALDATVQGPLALRQLAASLESAMFGLNKISQLKESFDSNLINTYMSMSQADRKRALTAMKDEAYVLGHELALRIARVNSKQKKIKPLPLINGMVNRMNIRFSLI